MEGQNAERASMKSGELTNKKASRNPGKLLAIDLIS